MDRRDLRLVLALAAASMAWIVVQGVAGLGDGFVMLAPALALALPLLAGRYLGEEAIERVLVALAARTASRGRPCQIAPRHPRVPLLPRGGRLIAASLATRPPPAAL